MSFQINVHPDRILDYEDLGLIKNGKPRLSYAQGYFTRRGINLKAQDTKELLVGLYLHWRGLPEYLIFEGENRHTWDKKWGAGLMAKRGNPIYRKRLNERLSFIEKLEEYKFFNYRDRSSRHSTRAIFVTLTWAVKECGSCGKPLSEHFKICPDCGSSTKQRSILGSWYGEKELKIVQRGENAGREYLAHKKGCSCVSCLWNKYVTNLREAYGNISIIRTWEGYETGYPHVHAVMLFHDHEFETFHHEGKWRIQGKHGSNLEGYGGGFSDVEGLASLRGGIKYVTKYLTKIHGSLGGGSYDAGSTMSNFIEASNQGDFTLSLLWLFRKRAFAVSGDFIDLIGLLHNSKSEGSKVCGQVDLGGDSVWVWRLKGFHTGCLPGVSGVPWSHRLDLKGVREVMVSPGYSDRCNEGQWGEDS